MATHYIDYERRFASTKRQGVLRVAAVVSSVLLASGYVIYRVRATPPPARVRVLSRVATVPVTNGAASFSLASTQPVHPTAQSAAPNAPPDPSALTVDDKGQVQLENLNSDQQILMSSSKSGAIIPPRQRIQEQRPPLTLQRTASPAPARASAPTAAPIAPATQPTTAPSGISSFDLKP
jgi:hypothetical protein